MTPEQLTKQLKQLLGAKLKSVILYGSAAAGDHTGKKSDFNVLVVLDRLATEELKVLGPITNRWRKTGNPPPLLFTMERLQQSADVFPIELLDIRECHRVLHGEDVTEALELSHDNLRVELEHELKGKLIQLRANYLFTAGKPKRVAELMIESLATFLVLFRAVVRLYQDEIPQPKMDALKALAEHITFDTSVFQKLQSAKEGSIKPRDIDAATLFPHYLETIESVVDTVDAYIRKEK